MPKATWISVELWAYRRKLRSASAIRLPFDLDTDASAEQLATLCRLTERYCVVYQTLRQPPEIHVSANRVRLRTSSPSAPPLKGRGARGAATFVACMVPPLLAGEGV